MNCGDVTDVSEFIATANNYVVSCVDMSEGMPQIVTREAARLTSQI